MIRRLAQADEAEWLRMRRNLWPDCPDEIHRHEMRLLVQAEDDAVVLVADGDDGRLDAFIEVSVRQYAEGCHSGRVGYIEGWYVAEARRGQGIGAALVRAAEAWAAERQCLEMASDAEIDNSASERAHRSLGYEDAGRLVHFRKWLRPTRGLPGSAGSTAGAGRP